MSVHRNRTPRMAALFLSVAVGGASLTMIPAAQAAPHSPASAQHAKVDAPATVVKRLSSVKGVAGDTILIQGTKLATGSVGAWVKKAVKFGETTVTASDVTALSDTALVVVVPAGANGTVVVTVGDAVKGPKFTYAAPITITTDQDDLDDHSEDIVSETGLVGAFITGTNFTKTTKIIVGGKGVKVAKDGVTATKITFDYPVGLIGVQDVVVVDTGVTHYLGYVTYTGKPVTVSGVTGTAYVEQASNVTVAGTALDLVTGVTYDGVKTTFKKVSATELTVTIPKGEAVADGALVVTTKYGATDDFDVDRVAAPVPTVSAVSTVTVSTAGVVTLTGTNLTGLKKVTFTNAAGKAFAGSKITVVSATSATVTIPALVAGVYKVSVTAISATPSTDFNVTVAPAPTVTTVTGAVAAGAEVTLVGTSLLGLSVVSVAPAAGGAAVLGTSINTITATGAKVTLPALTAGSYKMTVTATSGVSLAFTFTVAA